MLIYRWIVNLGEEILPGVARFPWLKKEYSALLTEETVTELLRDNSPIADMIEVDQTLESIARSWEKVANEQVNSQVRKT